MTEREMLERAAKAAGLAYEWNACASCGIQYIPKGLSHYVDWSPLTDDGDALRLAVRLQLTVANEHVRSGVTYCSHLDDDLGEVIGPEVHSGDQEDEVIEGDYAATRRAIVLAAAEIGRNI